jgi:hypothetical protein
MEDNVLMAKAFFRKKTSVKPDKEDGHDKEGTNKQ